MFLPQFIGVVPAECAEAAQLCSTIEAESIRHSRARIMANLATALRDSDASITNIESAITRAGLSMQEILASFGSTRELILAMVSELSRSMSAALTIGPTIDLKQRLLEFGRCVTHTYAASHLRALYRIAVTESIRQTGLGRDFYEEGLGDLTQRLADFLRMAQEQGVVAPVDPHLLASHFLSPLRAMLEAADPSSRDVAVSSAACSAYVRNVVDLFCRGINGGRQSC